jgi:hypothetical protein
MFGVAVGGNGLKYLNIDAPPATPELMDEGWGDRAEVFSFSACRTWLLYGAGAR